MSVKVPRWSCQHSSEVAEHERDALWVVMGDDRLFGFFCKRRKKKKRRLKKKMRHDSKINTVFVWGRASHAKKNAPSQEKNAPPQEKRVVQNRKKGCEP